MPIYPVRYTTVVEAVFYVHAPNYDSVREFAPPYDAMPEPPINQRDYSLAYGEFQPSEDVYEPDARGIDRDDIPGLTVFAACECQQDHCETCTFLGSAG